MLCLVTNGGCRLCNPHLFSFRTYTGVFLMSFLSYLINGISLGSVYAIIALGYTMVYGIAKMLNFAHGDVIMSEDLQSFMLSACRAGLHL